jgi:hypothetical protein
VRGAAKRKPGAETSLAGFGNLETSAVGNREIRLKLSRGPSEARRPRRTPGVPLVAEPTDDALQLPQPAAARRHRPLQAGPDEHPPLRLITGGSCVGGLAAAANININIMVGSPLPRRSW